MAGFGIFVLVCALLVLRMRSLEREKQKKIKAELEASYGSGRGRALSLEREKALEVLCRRRAGEQGIIDDITWLDLEMPAVFAQMNSCRSAAGEEELYGRIRAGRASREDLENWESLLRKLEREETLRKDLTYVLGGLGFAGNRVFCEDLETLSEMGEKAFPVTGEIIKDLLYLAGIPLILLQPLWGLLFYLCLVSVQVYTYFRGRSALSEYLPSVAYLLRLVRMIRLLPKETDAVLREEVPDLCLNGAALLSLEKGALFVMYSGRFAMSSGPLELLVTYLNILFHLDMIACRKILRGLSGRKEEILKVMRDAGLLDAAIAVDSWRAYLTNGGAEKDESPRYCTPDFAERGEHGFRMTDGYHPLLKKPVRQSLDTKRGIILTGSNASGKSTFLRTCGLCALLAQTIHTCTAAEYRAPVYRLFSSISLKDDLCGGESYFMTEIRAMKRVLDASLEQGDPVFCLVDEVLRGTNTSERISAGAQILNGLAEGGVLCFAATHDIELTVLCAQGYENYHFEEILSEEDVTFTYVLKSGPSTSKNAILLLKKAGFSLT